MKHVKQKGLFVCFIFFCIVSSAQTVLLSVDRNNEINASERGPNLKKFTSIFFRGGCLASKDNPTARIIYGSSVNLAVGVRNKYKISSVYSLGYEIECQYTDYKLKQTKGKIIPDTIINNLSGRLDYSSLGLGLYNRFNFDPHRGNYLGNFLDIGIAGEWDFSIKEISKNKREDGTVFKTTTKHLNYVNNLNTKVYARIGFSHFSLYGSYRLLDLFKPSSIFPDLPKLVLGIELSVF
jgi:hypothetical protein